MFPLYMKLTHLFGFSNLEPEPGVIIMEEDGKPEDRVESALKCLPHYDPASLWNADSSPFRYWKIRDYAHAYRSRLATPSMVSVANGC